MNAKKTEKADLRNKQGLFFQIGMVVAIGITLVAFNYKTSELPERMALTTTIQVDEMDFTQVTRTEQKQKEEVVQKRQPQAIEIVEDFIDPNEDVDILDTEADETSVVKHIDFVADDSEEMVEDTFVVVEDMPEFPGGNDGLLQDIMARVNYPDAAKELNLQGKVYVSFIVNKQGKVDQVKIARGVDPILDNEAIRVIKSLPDWKPGKQRGKPVNIAFTVPINFALH